MVDSQSFPAPQQVAALERVALASLQPNHLVEGVFRVARCLQRVSRTNNTYLVTELLDGVSSFRCYCWTPEIVDSLSLPEGALVAAEFITYEYQGTVRGRISDVEMLTSPTAEDIIATLPPTLCPIPGLVERLRAVVGSIRQPLLREFIGRAFGDYALAQRYFRVPASFGDHHAAPGGHAAHALEMALDTARTAILPKLHRDLAIVHAIFHDVGKIETHDHTSRSRELFRMIDHEALTLFILAEPLRWLEAIWPDGARALIVGWVPGWARSGRGGQPVVYPPAELVRGLDRASRAASLCGAHGRAHGGLVELSRQRAIWTPDEPPLPKTPSVDPLGDVCLELPGGVRGSATRHA